MVLSARMDGEKKAKTTGQRSPGGETALPAAPFHTTSLVVWLVAALFPAVLTRNPLYLLLCFSLLVLVHQRLAHHAPAASAWGGLLRLSLVFVLFTLVFNMLLGGYGETVLFKLPAWRVLGEGEQVLFQLGGPVTLESLVFGLSTAVVLTIMLLALSTFNTLVDHYQLLRGLPGFLVQAATIVSIAFTFIPQLFQAQKEMREALALRGHRVRGFRDLMPLLLNLVAEGLERAMALAESMEARGFSGPALSPRAQWIPRALIALALGLGLGGFLLREIEQHALLGLFLLAMGATVLTSTLWYLGRRTERSRYRRQTWHRRDSALVILSLLAVIALSGLYGFAPERFAFNLLPRVGWPPFDPWVAAPVLLLTAPMFLLPRRREEET
jgi:energy-coupling factor transport system permease protein